MIRHGKILVPTDFSDQSTEALRRAGVLAAQYEAEVHLLHILEPVAYLDMDQIFLPNPEEISKVQRDAAKKNIQKQSQAAGFAVTTHLEESMDKPAKAICRFAETLPTDLIVIGRHGQKGAIETLLIGSTAERVVRHAPCSVLVAMPHGLFEEEP